MDKACLGGLPSNAYLAIKNLGMRSWDQEGREEPPLPLKEVPLCEGDT